MHLNTGCMETPALCGCFHFCSQVKTHFHQPCPIHWNAVIHSNTAVQACIVIHTYSAELWCWRHSLNLMFYEHLAHSLSFIVWMSVNMPCQWNTQHQRYWAISLSYISKGKTLIGMKLWDVLTKNSWENVDFADRSLCWVLSNIWQPLVWFEPFLHPQLSSTFR